MVELLVALFLSMIIVFAVFYAWNGVSVHEATYTRKALLDAEAQRLGRAVSSDIRRSPQVVAIGQSRISLISDRTGDTVTYERSPYGEELVRNGKPMPIVAPGTRVAEFSVTQESSGAFAGDSGLLVTVRIALANDRGDSAAMQHRVTVRNPPPEQTGGVRGWNF